MKLLSQKQVCEALGIGRVTLWRLRRNNDFPRAIQVSTRRVAFRASEIEAYTASREL